MQVAVWRRFAAGRQVQLVRGRAELLRQVQPGPGHLHEVSRRRRRHRPHDRQPPSEVSLHRGALRAGLRRDGDGRRLRHRPEEEHPALLAPSALRAAH